MTAITNDTEFRRQLEGLDYARQRAAARFIEHVLDLCDDERIGRVAKVAANPNASADELATALHSARAAAIDSHARCGADSDWKEQAGYFVARAATAAVSPEGQVAAGPAWQAAMSSRMAQTSMAIETPEDTAGQERLAQYRILSEFLNA
ncbi:MAG: hypothetical protein ABFS22_04480 [Pseudomonadota bacterium]